MFKSRKANNYNAEFDVEFGMDNFEPSSINHSDRLFSQIKVKKIEKHLKKSVESENNTATEK